MSSLRPLAPYPDSLNIPHTSSHIGRKTEDYGGSPLGPGQSVCMLPNFQRNSYRRGNRLPRTQSPIDLGYTPWPTTSTYPLPECSRIQRQVEVAITGVRAASRAVIEAIATPHEFDPDDPDPLEYPALQAQEVLHSPLIGTASSARPQNSRQHFRYGSEMESWWRRHGIEMAHPDLYKLYELKMANQPDLPWKQVSSQIRARHWRDFQKNLEGQLPSINEDSMDLSEGEHQSTATEEEWSEDDSIMADCGSFAEDEHVFEGVESFGGAAYS
ncbi:hypothetical protein FHETE_6208 [Fusarium heterosporum]|uniref:Uncharacterized protein n=1 Tax=Fusarium heterosporum TaxID=42747 RepID=A0A8H5TB40_FUSHE|nr:hypothetical protein FHETE_6208 [Fusarium heterosporum]